MENSIDFLQLYEKIYMTLPSGNIQRLMEICYEIVGVPILTVDVTYNLFGIAPQEKKGDLFWDYLLENKIYNTEMAIHLYEDGIMQSVNEKKAPYVVDWGTSNEDFPKILGVIRVNGSIEGYVVMRCTREQITPDRMKAMEIIQNILSLFFKDNDTANTMHYTYQKVFIEELLNNRIQTPKQLGLWFENIGNAYKAPYRITAISTDNKQDKNVLSYIQKTIQQLFPYHFELIQQNILYILEYNLSANDYSSERQFDRLLIRFNAHCGISNCYENLLDTPDYKTQAEDALHLGRRIPRDSRIYRYEDYYLPAILAPRIEQMPTNNYLSPLITKIKDYDRKYSTNFLSTLYTYVKHLGNTSETASLLHVHRNTLLYRLKKIEEITDSSIRDYETFIHLAISFYMTDYDKS